MPERIPRSRGVALIEVAVALLLVSLGTLGLAGLQLSAKRASFEALQRSNAAGYAMDILERMRANPIAVHDYALTGAEGLESGPPPASCSSSPCSANDVALRDLWEWRSALEGTGEIQQNRPAGGLVNATACITVDGGNVQVAMAWQGLSPSSGDIHPAGCGSHLGRARQLLLLTGFISEL